MVNYTDPEQVRRRNTIRRKGKWHTVWREGVLKWGVPTALISAVLFDLFETGYLRTEHWIGFLILLAFSLVFVGLLGGVIWGLLSWKGLEKWAAYDETPEREQRSP